MSGHEEHSSDLDFEGLVERYYRGLYQFAMSLTGKEAEASDLTQQTFYVWAKKGHQLRDASKVKSWLFATLHREFLKRRRHDGRFPHVEVSAVEHEMPTVAPKIVERMDANAVLELLRQVDQLYQAPLTLFYLEDHSYKEIAEILDVPLGTVQSRIARGKAQLQKMLAASAAANADRHQGKERG